jgi:dihydroorotate dehydrogenase (NAD+) catalytic subunit
LNTDIEGRSHLTEFLLDKVACITMPAMDYRRFWVAHNKFLAEDLFLLNFDRALADRTCLGQYAFIWIPGRGERPFSILSDSPSLSFLIQARGECTRILQKLKPGDLVYIRGPYGNAPKVQGKLLLVGGGTGIAALLPFAKLQWLGTVAVLGAKNKAHLYEEPFKIFRTGLYSFVEEKARWPLGRGLVTDRLAEIICKHRPDFCLNCGPAAMIEKAIAIERQCGIPDANIYSSFDSYMACGVRICGKCATKAGYAPCVDGPFLTPAQLGL